MSGSPMATLDTIGLSGDVPLPGAGSLASTENSTQNTQDRNESPLTWFNPSVASSGFPYTPVSTAYDATQAMQLPTISKPSYHEFEKPLFTWSGQNVNPAVSGTYRDSSQATPSTAASWVYGQTPRTSESFLNAPGLTPLTSGHASDSSYTGLSPAFGYLASNSANDAMDQHQATIQQRRPVPIRHMTTNSVMTVPRSAPYGQSVGSWPYSYSGPIPAPMPTHFTLSQPPFSTRRMPNDPLPMYSPDSFQTSRRLHPSPGARGHASFRSVHYTPPGGRMGHARHASLGQEAKPPRFKPTLEQKAILIETYEKNP
jgi:hypothetical protein